MIKLNKKGLTLIELIVSIALMSIVMLFLYRLLANINYESDNDYFASYNQEQRIEMIDYIETLFRASDITAAPTVSISSNHATIQVKQAGISKVYNILVYANYIEVRSSSTVLRVWDLDKGVYSFANTKCHRASTVSTSSDDIYHPYVCTIPVYTVNYDNNANNNNTIDDITISFLARG